MHTKDEYIAVFDSGVGGISVLRHLRKALPGETRNIHAKNLTSRAACAVRFDNVISDSTFTNVKTFGDNLALVGTKDGDTETHNITFENCYYGITQQEIFCSTALDPSKYVGAVMDLPNFRGDMHFKNLHVDKVNTVAKAVGPITLTVDGYECNCALKTANMDGGKLIIDGKEIPND